MGKSNLNTASSETDLMTASFIPPILPMPKKARLATSSGDVTPAEASLDNEVGELAEQVEALTSESRSNLWKAEAVPRSAEAELQKQVKDVASQVMDTLQDEEFQKQVKDVATQVMEQAQKLANQAMEYVSDPENQDNFRKAAKDASAKAQAVIEDMNDPVKRAGNRDFKAELAQAMDQAELALEDAETFAPVPAPKPSNPFGAFFDQAKPEAPKPEASKPAPKQANPSNPLETFGKMFNKGA
jgi:hypothetical protein